MTKCYHGSVPFLFLITNTRVKLYIFYNINKSLHIVISCVYKTLYLKNLVLKHNSKEN